MPQIERQQGLLHLDEWTAVRAILRTLKKLGVVTVKIAKEKNVFLKV